MGKAGRQLRTDRPEVRVVCVESEVLPDRQVEMAGSEVSGRGWASGTRSESGPYTCEPRAHWGWIIKAPRLEENPQENAW